MRPLVTTALALGLAAWIPGGASELKPATLAAFDKYVALTEARMATEVAGASPFLWIDRQPAKTRDAARRELTAGHVVVESLETKDGGHEIPVPDGLIHHWIGTVLVPGAPLDRVMMFVKNYAAYPAVFGPSILSAHVNADRGDHYEVSMRTETHKVITVTIDADYTIDYRPIGQDRVWTRSVASNVREVQSAGTSKEQSRPAESGNGYLWRLNNYCSFEARPEGVYEQCESVSLSRDLPFGLGWMISPFVKSVPKETLEFTLGRVRSSVAK